MNQMMFTKPVLVVSNEEMRSAAVSEPKTCACPDGTCAGALSLFEKGVATILLEDGTSVLLGSCMIITERGKTMIWGTNVDHKDVKVICR